MGNILGKIRDEQEEYYDLCRKYNEIPSKLYSTHWSWLNDKHANKTTLNLKEYNDKVMLETIAIQIRKKRMEIEKLEKEMKEIQDGQ